MDEAHELPKIEGEKLTIGPSVNCSNKTHEFDRIKSMEAKCRKCGVGYILSPDCEVKDGHIYIDNMFLI